MRIVTERRKDVNVGDRTAMLVVIGPRFRYWMESGPYNARVCGCDCGNVVVKLEANIRSGLMSCGCLLKTKSVTHGQSRTPLHRMWAGMKTRCTNQKEKMWDRYGGRGISVCKEWSDSFEAFAKWALEHGWHRGLEIDRENNDGNYEPGNCRFITKKENSRNRHCNRVVEAFGESKLLCEWPEDARCCVSYATLHARMKLGWSAERAITQPIYQQRPDSEASIG